MSVHISEWPIPKVCDCHKPEESQSTIFYEVLEESRRIAMFTNKSVAIQTFYELAKTMKNIDLVEVIVKDNGYFETCIVLTNKK